MMSASTMTFLGVAPGAAAPGAPAETTVAEGADFLAALAALAAAPVAATRPVLPTVIPVEEPAVEPALDSEAVAALLASMLPAAAPPPEDTSSAELPVMSAADDGESLDAAAVLEAASSLAGSIPGIEAGTAAAAAVAIAAAAPGMAATLPPQSGTGEAVAAQAHSASLPGDDRPQRPAASPLPPYAAKLQAALPQPPAEDAASASGTAATPAVVPAAQVPASPVPSSLLVSGGATPREPASGPRADVRPATQGLRGLLQAMAWSDAATTQATGDQTVATADAAAGANAALPQDLQALLAARGRDEATALNLPQPAVQAELPEQALAPSPAAAGLLQATANSAAASPAAGAEQAVRSPVGTPRWAEELGNQLVLMNARGQQEGSLTLTPEHLGPLEVRISVNHGTANVWFGAQHADTRAALAEAMPRLRELFDQAGLSLGHADVSQQAPRQDRREAGQQESTGVNGVDAPGNERDVPASVRRITRGLLDTYA